MIRHALARSRLGNQFGALSKQTGRRGGALLTWIIRQRCDLGLVDVA